MERHFRRLAQQILDLVGIFHAGQFHHDAVGSLPFDLRIHHAGFVDTPADDFDGLLHGMGGRLFQRGGGEGERLVIAGEVRDCEFAGHAFRDRPERRHGRIMLRGIAQVQEHALVVLFGG